MTQLERVPTAGAGGPSPAPGAGSRPAGVAVFDLDGTLVRGHSMPRFVVGLAGPRRAASAVVRAAWAWLAAPGRGRFKARVLAVVLTGRPMAQVTEVADELARRLVADRLDLPHAALLQMHRCRGDALVLLTSSLDLYADAVGRRLGFHAVLAPRTEVRDGRCTGVVHDPDLTGGRKVERLRGWIDDAVGEGAPATVYAYGNARSDRQLLHHALATQVAT